MQHIVPNLTFDLIGILIGSLVSAVLLVQAFKWIEKRTVAFPRVFFAAFVGSILSIVLQLTAVSIFEQAGRTTRIAASFALIPIIFAIQAGLVAAFTHTRFARACLISFVALIVGVAVIAGIALLVWGMARLMGL
jgi:hypothetical protein